jgi:hypothetical protein
MNMFLPKDRVHIPELEVDGTVVEVLLNIRGTQYAVRYFRDGLAYEVLLYDHEVTKTRKVDA